MRTSREGEEQRSAAGDRTPASPITAALFERMYAELRRLAAASLRAERAGHTLQPTALVHEAFLKLAARGGSGWRDERQFRAAAATAMRQILVDHARGRRRRKRGGGAMRMTLDEDAAVMPGPDVDLLALDEAMVDLAKRDERKARVVELRFFAGMTCDEAAEALAIAPKTAEADWYMARAWLRRRMEAGVGT
jgi:RNA polymerase sigma factor (TIGR02999 family)